MPIDPRSSDSIFNRIESDLVNSINKVTNFVSGSFNATFLSAYSSQIRETEIKALAVQLSAYPEYAGKELTEDDFEDLGITNVEPAEVNEYVKQSDLDQLAELVGVTREDGVKATGTVTFTVTDDEVTIPEGFPVATEPSGATDSLRFFCDVNESGSIESNSTDTVQPDPDETTVSVPVIAEFVGEQYNIGSGSITFLPSQLPGIVSVTNPFQITGGVGVESTESLRERTKDAVFRNSGGGTREGVIGAIQRETGFNASLSIRENFDRSPRVVEVIADVTSGSEREQTIKDIVERVRPVGVKHRVLSPTEINLRTIAELQADDISRPEIVELIEGYIQSISFGDLFTESVLTSQLFSADNNIQTVTGVNTAFTTISDERHVYTGDDTIRLEKSPFSTVTDEEYRYQSGKQTYSVMFDDIRPGTERVIALVDGTKKLLNKEANEYSLVDTDNDGKIDSIKLNTSVVQPDSESTIDFSYRHNNFSVDSVQTPSQTFEQGVDYEIADTDSDTHEDGIQWIDSGQTPDLNTKVAITYTTNRSLNNDYKTKNEEKLFINNPDITVRNI